MKRLLMVLCVVATSMAFGDAAKNDKGSKKIGSKEEFEIRKRAMIDERLGGRFEKPGTKKGVVFVVNAQKRVAASVVSESVAALKLNTNLDIQIKEGAFALPAPVVEGNATLFLVDDEKCPMSLFAPESRWAMINVQPLATGRGSDVKFLTSRTKKMIVRGISLLCGAQESQFRKSVVGGITSPEQLDDVVSTTIPFDVVRRFGSYLECYGIAPAELIPYAQACQQGWAPSPTNDRQRAIWEKVHSLPKNPIKIEKKK